MSTFGYIYYATSPHMTVCKIGRTKNPDERYRTYRTSFGASVQFKVFPVSYYTQAEKELLQLLRSKGLSNAPRRKKDEVFRITLQQAEKYCKNKQLEYPPCDEYELILEGKVLNLKTMAWRKMETFKKIQIYYPQIPLSWLIFCPYRMIPDIMCIEDLQLLFGELLIQFTKGYRFSKKQEVDQYPLFCIFRLMLGSYYDVNKGTDFEFQIGHMNNDINVALYNIIDKFDEIGNYFFGWCVEGAKLLQEVQQKDETPLKRKPDFCALLRQIEYEEEQKKLYQAIQKQYEEQIQQQTVPVYSFSSRTVS